MKKFLLTLCLSAAMLMSAATAQADSFSWSYDVKVTLEDMQFSTGAIGDVKELQGGAKWSWGGPTDYSSLTAVGGSGTITSDGEVVRGVTMTHDNQVIFADNPLLIGGTIRTSVTLKADGDEAITLNNKLSFNFLETYNDVETNGVYYSDDIFYMTTAAIMSSVAEFAYGGNTYYMHLLAELKPLDGEYLRLAQEAGGYSSATQLFGWTTKEGENHSNAYELKLVISRTPPVPVPAAVWLMGTGLAGLVAIKRRSCK